MKTKLYHAAFLPLDRNEDSKPTILSYVADSLADVATRVASTDWLKDHECIGIQYVQDVQTFGTITDFE